MFPPLLASFPCRGSGAGPDPHASAGRLGCDDPGDTREGARWRTLELDDADEFHEELGVGQADDHRRP
jgi:hypothetical protein